MADYSGLDRFLHRLALGNPAVAEMLHDLERGLYLKSSPESRGGAHVFVSGLARAGSTILMREIHATGAFGSLTYADMPFVLAPNLWAGLARQKPLRAKTERAHGDGIAVDTHSPEALEEVFWRHFCGPQYLSGAGLSPHVPAPDVLAGYADFVRLILRRTGKSRYLAKNNNSILRLPSLARAMPASVILVPIRAPLAHAQSLLHQHRRFLQADDFTTDYMGWLGHHEFGRTQRPFLMGRPMRGDPETLDYWLEAWTAVHAHLAQAVPGLPNARFVPHEDLTADSDLWPRLCALLQVPATPLTEARPMMARAAGTTAGAAGRSGPHQPEPHSPTLAAEAQALYDSLRETARMRDLRAG